MSLKGFGRISIIIIGVYAVIALFTGDTSFLSMLMLVFCAMLPMTATSLDEQSKWNAYVQCMPVSRGQVVRSKYLMLLLTAVAAMVITLLLTALSAFRGTVDWGSVFASLLTNLWLIMLMNAISIPFIYKLGVEKARLVILLSYVAILMPTIMVSGGTDSLLITQLASIANIAVPVLAVVGFSVSYQVSLKIYAKKEF